MVVDFGWSIDTVIALITVSWKVYAAFEGVHNASAEYQALVQDYSAFHHGLGQLQELLEQYRVPVVFGCDTWQRTIEACQKFQSHNALLQIDPKSTRDSFSKALATVRWPFNKDIPRLRREIATSLHIASLYSNKVILRTVLEERNASITTRAEIDEIYRRTVPFAPPRDTHELHSTPHRGQELPADSTAHAISNTHATARRPLPIHGLQDAALSASARPSLVEAPSAPCVVRTPAELPLRPQERLQYLYNELSVFDHVLRMQELEGASALPQIPELSELNHDPEHPPLELEGDSTFVLPARREIASLPGSSVCQIQRTRTEIQTIRERVQNAQKRISSMDSNDSGYGTGHMDSPETLVDFILRGPGSKRIIRSPESTTASPLSSSPRATGLSIPTQHYPVSPPSSWVDSSSPPSRTGRPPSLHSPVIRPKSRTDSMDTGVLSRVDSNAEPHNAPSTICENFAFYTSTSKGSRSYLSELCQCSSSCPTRLSCVRRSSGGLSFFIRCTASNIEIEHQLSSTYEPIPHISHAAKGNPPHSVTFDERGSKGVQCPSKGLPFCKGSATYIFKSEHDCKTFQEWVLGKTIVETLPLEAIHSSVVPVRGSRTETLRVLRDDAGAISLLTHGALRQRGFLEDHEAMRADFKTLVDGDIHQKGCRVTLHLDRPADSPNLERRRSSSSNESSARSGSASARSPRWIELDFEDRASAKRFVKLWEPSWASIYGA